jgi:hypothetical protein
MSSQGPSTPALQRILAGDSQEAILNEVSSINASGNTVLKELLNSNPAYPSSPIRLPSPVRLIEKLQRNVAGPPSIELLPFNIGATLALIDAGLEPLEEQEIEISASEESKEDNNPYKLSFNGESNILSSPPKRLDRKIEYLDRLESGRSSKIR